MARTDIDPLIADLEDILFNLSLMCTDAIIETVGLQAETYKISINRDILAYLRSAAANARVPDGRRTSFMQWNLKGAVNGPKGSNSKPGIILPE